jgi:hypothetical protein
VPGAAHPAISLAAKADKLTAIETAKATCNDAVITAQADFQEAKANAELTKADTIETATSMLMTTRATESE